MDWLHLLVILASFLGFGVGYLLKHLAKEEVRYGKKYFLFIEKVLLVAAFVPGLYVSVLDLSLAFILICIAGFVAVLYARSWTKLALLTALFAFLITVTQNSPLYLVQASLVFLYGLPSGTLVKA